MVEEALRVTESNGGVRFAVHVKPRASRNAIVGQRGDALAVAVTAPPVDGEANAAICALVADALGLKARDVVVVSGETHRGKVVEARGICLDEARRKLRALLADDGTK